MTVGQLLRQSARMTRRDWRAGELRLLAAALVIAVSAVTSVGFFVDRLRVGLQRDATQLLGADVVLSSTVPIVGKLRQRAVTMGLQTAETVTFPSMAINAADADLAQLVAVKAVSSGYPLRGALRVKGNHDEPDIATHEVPARGTVWVDPQALHVLRLAVGERLWLGESSLIVERLIAIEPDRAGQFINFAPRVMLNLADLVGTQLIQEGSRVTYRLLIAGERNEIDAYTLWAKTSLDRGQRVESLEGGRPEMQRTLEHAERFLSLVALLAAMVAAVAVAAAARRFSLRRLDTCAMLRCLGLTQRDMVVLFALEFVWVGVVACLVGVAGGYALHFVVLEVLRSLILADLPLPTFLPVAQGFACGLVLLLGFALPPLAQLRHVSPLRVLRRDLGPPAGSAALGYSIGLVGFFGLLLWSSNDVKIGSITAGGFALGMVAYAVIAWLVLKLLAPARALTGRLGITWRFAVAAVQRRPMTTVVQLVALAIGLMALLLLTVTRTDLVNAWRRAAPADAPNRFVINIQPEQVKQIAQRLADAGLKDVTLYPMIRGRLVAINGESTGPENFKDDRAQRLVDREFNLSYADAPPSHNPIVAGSWFGPGAAELSIEEGIARTLGVKLGDTLSFEIAGNRLSARATSLRKVNWDSMRANFYVIMPPAILSDQPKSFITAFHLPATKASFAGELLREFPNLTVVDTSAIFLQVQAVLDKVIAAVEFLFVFTLVAGVLVLYSALAATHDERVREAGLLRVLGASRKQLLRVQTAEMLCLGGLAGLLAAAGASAIGWALARYAFEFDYAVSPWIFALGVGGGAACALVGGWFGLRGILKTPPLATLRDA